MLKIVALVTMFVDHFALIFLPENILLRIIGRMAFPIFAFGISFGYLKTKNALKYAKRIFFLALISQPIFFLLISQDYLNVCFTLLFGLIAIYIYDKSRNNFLKFSLLTLVLFFSEFLNLEYGAYGVLMILFFFVFRGGIGLVVSQAILVFSFVLLKPESIVNIFAIFSVLFIHYFKDYDFKINKYLQYSFYPLHLILLYLALYFYQLF